MDAAASRRRLTRIERAASRLHAALAPALPVLAIFGGLCLIYGWQAWRNTSPWVVPDEFERAQLSRAIAATGHAAQRSVPQPFPSLYVYLIAPAWWIHNTAHAYALVKAIGVATMTAVLFPTYLLARMLAPKRWALFAAAGAAMVPALAYSPLLMLETLAYPWAALCFYLLVKALVTPRPRWLVAAAAACLVAPRIRTELGVILAGAVGAAFAFWFTSESGRRLRRNWTAWHWVGFAVLAVAAVTVADVVAAHQSSVWQSSTEHHAGDMLRYGLRAFGALTIGLGVLPTVAGLTALVNPRHHPASREHRAFVCTTVAMLASFGLYAASKATFIAPTGQPFLLERNVIYTAPLLFAGTALVLSRRRASTAALAAATAFAVFIVTVTPYGLRERFTFDAPGLSLLQRLHEDIGLTTHAATAILIALAVLSGCFLLLIRRGPSTLALGAAAAFVLAWSTYGEIGYSRASHNWMKSLIADVPQPLDWVDRSVPHGAQVYYLGHSISDPSDINELEFWNRSLQHVWSTDCTAPGPGPTVTPSVSLDGRLRPGKDVRYIVVESGISPVGHVIARKIHSGGGQAPKPWTLVRVAQPLRLRQSVEGFYGNGWGGPLTALNEYSTPDNAANVLRIDVSRRGLDPNIPATVRVRVGRLAVSAVQFRADAPFVTTPVMGKVFLTRTLHVAHNLDHVFTFRAPNPPFRVETTVTPLSQHDFDPSGSRTPDLGAYIDYLVYPKHGR